MRCISMSEEEAMDRLLIVDVQIFEEKRRYDYLLLIKEIKVELSVAMLTSKHNNELT